MREVKWLCAAALLSASCTLAPAYTRPEAPVADAFPTAGPDAQGTTAAADLGWRDVFRDARLQALVALALDHNRDLEVSRLTTERLRALYRIQLAPLMPGVGVGASATLQKPPAGIPSAPQQFSLTVGVTSWELDFFGRIRSLSDAALERYLGSLEAQRGAQLSLVSQVALADLTARAAAEQLELAKKTLELVDASLAITRRSFDLGLVPELDLRTSESQVEQARFNLALAEQRAAQAQNALTFVVGAPLPADLPPGAPLATTDVLGELPAGLPSDLLQRRPDILAAEHELKAANASIGAARAAFFPSITLTGSTGFGSTELGNLFSGDGFTWLFAPRINIPIFQGGALRANLDAAHLSKSIQVAQYERSIQSAFREVSDALVAQQALSKQLAAQAARVTANERRYALADERYRVGIDSYLSLLTAQRDLFTSQQSLIDARLARLANVATLYRALGGGWQERTADAGSGG